MSELDEASIDKGHLLSQSKAQSGFSALVLPLRHAGGSRLLAATVPVPRRSAHYLVVALQREKNKSCSGHCMKARLLLERCLPVLSELATTNFDRSLRPSARARESITRRNLQLSISTSFGYDEVNRASSWRKHQSATSAIQPLSASANATRWATLMKATCQYLRVLSGVLSVSSVVVVIVRMACSWSRHESGAVLRFVLISWTAAASLCIIMGSFMMTNMQTG